MATGNFTLKQVNQAIAQGAWTGYIAPKWVEYLVVAGGGGNGGETGGGAGAGGLLTGIVTVATGASYTVTVGAGGAGGSYEGAIGGNSVFGSISTIGGGPGTDGEPERASPNGGSGAGAWNTSGTINRRAGQGIAGQGNRGGNGGTTGTGVSGGGGGAGTVGLNASGSGSVGYCGNGGAGIASAITGTTVVYAGGGGGGAGGFSNGVAGTGGVGGGGAGAAGNPATQLAGASGGANTGGGAGGSSSFASSRVTGGAGGSGIVVVRYPGNVQFFTGGTVNYANGYIIHIFTASGTLAPTAPTVFSTSYQISRSLRFNSADTAYLDRTPASASNRRTWTWSAWIKRSSIVNASVDWRLFECRPTAYTIFDITYSGATYPNTLRFLDNNGAIVQTTPLYRDVSAWYHIVLAVDTTQATDSNRLKIYVNGVQVTSFVSSTYPTQNLDMQINTANTHDIGRDPAGGGAGYFDGYMTDIHFVDGQQLTPSSFGATDPTDGVWAPIQYTGTYGTNGFKLNFSDNSNTTAATLGADSSGNGNNWTPYNFSVTAGAGNDSVVDTPTPYGFDTGEGGSVRGNYCTLNPVSSVSGQYTISNGNLQIVSSNAYNSFVNATFNLPSSGKWYFEYSCTNTSGSNLRDSVGFAKNGIAQAYLGDNTNTLGYNGYTGGLNGYASGSYSTWTNGDVIGVAIDCDTGKVWISKNNTWQNSGSPTGGTGQVATLTDITNWIPSISAYSNSSSSFTVNGTLNFGQRPFAYTAPSGFKALCTTNLPTPAIGGSSETLASKFFTPTLFTGTGSSRTITTGMQSDFIWTKSRSQSNDNMLFDSVRGISRALRSQSTSVESYDAGYYVTSFNSDGYNIGGSDGALNSNGQTYVSWTWKANGSSSTNTAGTITSTVSANQRSGFSIVTYTGNGTQPSTVGHGLGVAPKMYIVKCRSTTGFWPVWHTSLYAQNQNTYIALNYNSTSNVYDGVFTNVAPTSTTFAIGADGGVNTSGATYVAYCFADVEGYSKAFSYTANNSSDGPFVHLGFRPAFIMLKGAGVTGAWWMMDVKRNTYNIVDKLLFANLSNAEDTYSSIDILSNGFKIRNTNTDCNTSAYQYVGFAFAESPFKYSLAR